MPLPIAWHKRWLIDLNDAEPARKDWVCCGLWGLICATDSAPVQRSTSGKQKRTATRTKKLVMLATRWLNARIEMSLSWLDLWATVLYCR